MAITGLARKAYTNASYKVFNIGAANAALAYSSEIGVPVDADGTHIGAVERIIELAEQRRADGGAYHTAPIALRFVAASDAHMAMMHGRDTMMIELIELVDTEGGYELLGRYEDALYRWAGDRTGGRSTRSPAATTSCARTACTADGHDRWQAIRAQLDPDDCSTGRSPSASASRARGNDRPPQVVFSDDGGADRRLPDLGASSARAGWRACTARPGPTGRTSRSSSCAPDLAGDPTSGAASRARCARCRGSGAPPRAGAGERRARRDAVPDPAAAARRHAARPARRGRPARASTRSSRLCRHVAPGSDALHARGIVHRDVKPANILFDAHGARAPRRLRDRQGPRRQRAHAPGPAGRHARHDGARADPRRAR